MKQARRDLPKIIDEKVTPEPDKEESMLKGNKVNAYLYRKRKCTKIGNTFERSPKRKESHRVESRLPL